MPAIKLKKAAAEHQAEKEREERERESTDEVQAPKPPVPIIKPPKETPSPGAHMKRGLDSSILLEKRKRVIPASEQKFIDWIDANVVESKDDTRVTSYQLYDFYVEACSFDGTPVVNHAVFAKKVTEKFGKSFTFKESSAYKGLVKEKKMSKEKKDTVKAESLKLKMKDIIEEALKEAGNPAKGVRFHSLKQYIACNYPALRIDLRPAYLKVALEKGVRIGYIQLVKGVGQAGFYRLPVDEEPDENGENPEEDTKHKDRDESEVQNGDSEGQVVDDTSEKSKETPKKSHKRKKPSSGEKGDEEKAEGEEGTEEVKAETAGEEGEPKKKKKKKPIKRRRPKGDVSYHSAPKKIEDTFALAMTYMCEPKQASFGKIKKYISEHYPNINVEESLRPAMENGVKKGFWDHVTGNGMSGTFQLMIDEFDPNSNDNIEDMICSAIIACNEPKQASVVLLKRYVLEYHPEFNVESKPNRFKMALERAIKKNMIIQISGLGATGSFQMWSSFTPSPAVLAGEDDEEEEVDTYYEKEELYVPRGTKSRGAQSVRRDLFDRGILEPPPKKRPAPRDRSAIPAKRVQKTPAKKSAKAAPKVAVESSPRRRGPASYAEDDEDDDDEEEAPRPPKAKSKSKPAPKSKKGGSPKKAPTKKDEEEDDDEGEKVEYTPRKSKSRVNYAEDEVKEEEEESKSSHGRGKDKRGHRSSVKTPKYVEDDDSEEEAPIPKKSKSRGGKSGDEDESKKSKSRGGESEEEEGEGEKVEYTPRKSKSRGGKVEKERQGEEEKQDEEEEEEEEKIEYVPKKSKSRGGGEETPKSEAPSPKKKGKKRR